MKVIKWVILISFLDSGNSFATSEAFAAVLDIFQNTRFHDTQIATALCITQYRFLQRNLGTPAREPSLYESCPYSDWGLGVAEYATAQKVKLEFMYYVDRPDIVEALKSNPISHFDAESFIQGSNHNLIQNRQTVFMSVKRLADSQNDLGSIRQLLGQSLHTIQDFYAHTNWVEMGYQTINTRVGEDAYLGVPINPPNADACRECLKSEMTDGELAQLNRAKSSTLNNALLGLIDFSFDNVYVCRDNIISKNYLTSGYYSAEATVAPKPRGKCSHGGGTDATDTTCAPGGISKDADTLIFAPHYYLHQAAANLSVQATIRYFEDLRLSIGDENLFGLIIGMSKYTSLAFVVDTTASMITSINATRLYAKQLLNNAPGDAITYVTLFADPGVGPVTKFNDKTEAMAYLYSFTPSGGDDIPEMTYNAILATAKQVPPETNVYVFTDAPSKNPTLQGQIQTVANQKKLQINFILSGTRDRPSYRNSSAYMSQPASQYQPNSNSLSQYQGNSNGRQYQPYSQTTTSRPGSNYGYVNYQQPPVTLRPQYQNIWQQPTTPRMQYPSNYYYYSNNFRGKRNSKTTYSNPDIDDFKGYRRLSRATNGLFLTPQAADLESLGKINGCGSWETMILVEDFEIGCGNRVFNWTLPGFLMTDETLKIQLPSFSPSELKKILHGIVYQNRLSVICLIQGSDYGVDFCHASEMSEAGKFDDIVTIQRKNGKIEFRFIQAKHGQIDEDGKVKEVKYLDLIGKEKDQFNLEKYFTSYRMIISSPKFQKNDYVLKDFIICTNKRLNKVDLETNGITCTSVNDDSDKLFKALSEVERGRRVSSPVRYHLAVSRDHYIFKLLKAKTNLTLFAESLATDLLQNKRLTLKNNRLYVMYHMALRNIIKLEANEELFNKDFIDGNDLSKEDMYFRSLLGNALIYLKPENMDHRITEWFTRTNESKIRKILEKSGKRELSPENYYIIEYFIDKKGKKISGFKYLKKNKVIQRKPQKLSYWTVWKFTENFISQKQEIPESQAIQDYFNVSDLATVKLIKESDASIRALVGTDESPDDDAASIVPTMSEFSVSSSGVIDGAPYCGMLVEREEAEILHALNELSGKHFTTADEFGKYDKTDLKNPKKLAALFKSAPKINGKYELNKTRMTKENKSDLKKLAYRVLVCTKDSGYYKFSSSFIEIKFAEKCDRLNVPNFKIFKGELLKEDPLSLENFVIKINDFYTLFEEEIKDGEPLETFEDNEITDADVEGFFDKFIFAANQPNEEELAEITKIVLQDKFKLNDVDLIYSYISESSLNWLKEKKGRYIDGKEVMDCLIRAEQKQAKFLAIALTATYCQKHNIKQHSHTTNIFNDIVEKFLIGKNNNILIFSVDSKQFKNTADVIIKTIKRCNQYKPICQDSYIACKLSTALSMRATISSSKYITLLAFECETSSLLILECSYFPSFEKKEQMCTEFCKELIKILKKKESNGMMIKKLICIESNAKATTAISDLLKDDSLKTIYKNVCNSINDLTEDEPMDQS